MKPETVQIDPMTSVVIQPQGACVGLTIMVGMIPIRKISITAEKADEMASVLEQVVTHVRTARDRLGPL